MRRIIGILTITVGLVMGTLGVKMGTADAHQQPYDSGIQTEHNLCQIMRPYGVGTVVAHYRIDGYNRQCFVCIGNTLYAYNVKFFYVWSGPHNTTLIAPNPSPSC